MPSNLMFFITILAWFAFVSFVVVTISRMYMAWYLNSTRGEIDQLIAGLEGKKLVVRPFGHWLWIGPVSTAWLIMYYFS